MKCRKNPMPNYHYSLMDVLMASATEPMPAAKRVHQLSKMWEGLASLETAAKPLAVDWRMCSDAVNLMETFIEMGVCEDSSGLLQDAIGALAEAGHRRLTSGQPIRLTGAGMLAVRAVLEDYAQVLETVPHRTALEAHRRTERRIHEIHTSKRRPHDVEVLAL